MCSAHVLEIADEDQALTGLDHPAGSLVDVRQMRRNLQSASSSDLHHLDALITAVDDHSGSALELQRRATIIRVVEILYRGMGDSDVLHADCVAGARLCAGADDVIDDDELGGRFAAGEVDLWFLLAHDASCGVVGGSRPEPQPWAERMSMTKMRVA